MAAIVLAACEMTTAPEDVVPPPHRPDTAVPAPSPESEVMRNYFNRVQADLITRGLMRTDGGGPDTPFTPQQLIDNFVNIALFDEYVNVNGRLVPRTTTSSLRRWDKPIRMHVIFGDTVPLEQRVLDKKNIRGYVQRLSGLTGLPVYPASPETANFHVLMLNEGDRRDFGPRLRELVPGVDDTTLRTVIDMPKSTFCLVFAFSQGNSSTYSRAVAVIRAEHPDRLRNSCIHEELAQGLGLANDSPTARPSIFNDDEEFAYLTAHDELLLKMLYDRRLTPGMREAEARPILRTIVDDLLGTNTQS
jgi:hypothetical protein